MPGNDTIYAYPSIDAALEAKTVDELKRLAALVPVATRPSRKADLVLLIASYLKGDGLRQLWTQLDNLQQKAVSETVHGPDYAYDGNKFKAKYGKEPDWGARERWDYTPSRLGLLFYNSFMPVDIKERLKAFVPPPAPLVLASHEGVPPTTTIAVRNYDAETRKYVVEQFEIPITQRPMERAAQHDLIAVLRLVGTGKLAISEKTRLPTAATVKAITGLLQGGDFYGASDNDANEKAANEKAANKKEASAKEEQGPDAEEQNDDEPEIGPIKGFAWPMLLQAARLAELSNKRLALTDAGRKALTAPLAKTLKAIWQAWLKTDVLDELRRIDAIKGQTGKGQRGLTAPRSRRAQIAAALADCETGRWVLIADFLRYMVAADLNFEVTRDLWTLYIDSPSYGLLGNGGNAWVILQKRYILCLLFEYAATLGLLDVAYISPTDAPADYTGYWGADYLEFLSRYDGLLYMRLTSLDAYCLGINKEYTPAPQETRPILKVLPNYDIVITEDVLTASDTLLLQTYAEQTSPVVWKLDSVRMLDAMEAGHKLEELQEFLETRSATELPNTVLRMLRDFAARNGRMKDKGVAKLIECADGMLATLIANDTRAKKYCYLAGERHLAVPLEFETAFRKAVKQIGYILPL